jgi:hypothetical protein
LDGELATHVGFAAGMDKGHALEGREGKSSDVRNCGYSGSIRVSFGAYLVDGT